MVLVVEEVVFEHEVILFCVLLVVALTQAFLAVAYLVEFAGPLRVRRFEMRHWA